MAPNYSGITFGAQSNQCIKHWDRLSSFRLSAQQQPRGRDHWARVRLRERGNNGLLHLLSEGPLLQAQRQHSALLLQRGLYLWNLNKSIIHRIFPIRAPAAKRSSHFSRKPSDSISTASQWLVGCIFQFFIFCFFNFCIWKQKCFHSICVGFYPLLLFRCELLSGRWLWISSGYISFHFANWRKFKHK